MLRPLFRIFFSALILVSLQGGVMSARAQQAVTSAMLSGRVEDASGGAIVGAAITLTNLDKNQVWKTTSGEQGRFRFFYLPVGSYRLEAGAPGFAGASRQLTLSVGEALDLVARLGVASRADVVSVTSEVPVVETVRTQVAETVLPREVDSLPLNGRNYLDLALLTPAASRTNTGNNELFTETSAVPGTGISVAGQRNLNNSFLVDGLSANDDAADLAGAFYSQEVIREFQVVASGGIAEFGRASSGTINVLTKSGTNDWRGRLYGFLRNQALDARNPAFAARKDPLTQTQYGASLGGPLAHDRTFLFSNFEQTRQHRAGFISIAGADVTAINTVLDQVNYKGPRVQRGSFPTGYNATSYFARVDHKLNEGNMLGVRYSLYDITSINARNAGGLNAVSRGTALVNRDNAIAVQETATLSPKSINEARFQYTRSRLGAPVNDAVGPAINISGRANSGTATFSPTARDIDLMEASDSLTWQLGEHALKAGADFLYNRVNIVFPGALQGVYTFTNLANFQARAYSSFQQAFGVPAQFQSNPNLGLFLQDEWRPRRDLTINAGLRYDIQWLPNPIETRFRNFGPRIGLAYAPGNHRTVIRAGYGIYFDRIPLRAVSNALQRDGSKYKTAVLNFGDPGAPVFPNVLSAFPAGLLASITTIDPNIQNAYSQQANLQIERELPHATSISVGYIHLRGLHIIMSRNINLPATNRPDPRFANIGQYASAGDSYYNAMTLAVNHRAARWASARLSYTLSKSVDDAGNAFFSQAQNPLKIWDDRGLSNSDQRHRLALSGSFDVPRADSAGLWRRAAAGFQLSYIFTFASAYPFNIQTGGSLFNDGNFNARPPGVGRNTGAGFEFSSMDLRLSRTFSFTEKWKLEMLAESFNTLNHSNLQSPNNITSSPTFGKPTTAADPRQIQFGLRLSF